MSTTMYSTSTAEDLQERYILPHTLSEIDRMRNQHEWVKGCASGLVKAPLDTTKPRLRIMDSATADGYWIRDVADMFPKDAEFVGFDITPDFYPPLHTIPPKVHYEVQNLIEPFPAQWKGAFDLVHQRFIISLFPDREFATVLRSLIDCVKPGGWIQLVEPDFGTPVSEPADKAIAFQTIHKLTGQVMADNHRAARLATSLAEEGMIDVSIEIFDMIAGNAHPDPELGARGRQNLFSILAAFMSGTRPRDIGLTEAEWSDLPVKFAEDMDTHKTAIRHYFVWAQKPLKQEAKFIGSSPVDAQNSDLNFPSS
ncbi:MAG: hypothetical protein M1830_008793 [Pleopsidium flavum]|nr:MAG: hypothetical protein M1830_008793 [Pleopsidium flavum]